MQVMTTVRYFCETCRTTKVIVYNPHPASQGPNDPLLPESLPCDTVYCSGVRNKSSVERQEFP